MTESKSDIGHFMIGVGGVIEHTSTGKILMLKRDKVEYLTGNWDLIYGRVDQHEELLDGLFREIKEETGLTNLTVKKVLRVWHFYRGEHVAEREIFGLSFWLQSESDVVKLNDEASAYNWVAPEEAYNLVSITGVKIDVKLFMEQRHQPSIAFSGIEDQIYKELNQV